MADIPDDLPDTHPDSEANRPDELADLRDAATQDADGDHAATPEGERAAALMTDLAADAFEHYYALGAGRSLRRLAEERGAHLRQLERWSSRYAWPLRCRLRHQDELVAARTAAKKEAATLARRRLRNAQLMQEAALTILSMAKIMEMEPEEARKALGEARSLLVEGMRAERLELGEVTDRAGPPVAPRPVHEMSDEELDAYIALLERTEADD